MAEPPAKKRKKEPEDASTMEEAHENTTNQSPSHTHDDLVTLLVGPDEEELVALGHRLAQSSAFFRTALKEQWKEGRQRVIKLPEDDVDFVKQYLNFLYGTGFSSQTIKELDDFDPEASVYENLFDLYAFGDRVLDTNLRNAVIKEFIRIIDLDDDEEYLPTSECINTLYARTPKNSPARRVLVDLQVYRGPSVDLEGLDKEYVVDAINGYVARIQASNRLSRLQYKKFKLNDYLV